MPGAALDSGDADEEYCAGVVASEKMLVFWR